MAVFLLGIVELQTVTTYKYFSFYGKDRIHPCLFMTIETSRGLIPYTENSWLGNFYPFLNAKGEQPAFFLKYFPKSDGLLNDRTSAI